MAQTIVGVGDPKAVKRYSAFLAVDVGRESYFSRKFMGRGVEAQTPIQMLEHLENDAGDNISYDLVMQLRMQPVEGDSALRGKEEDLKFYSDNVYIDQMRGGVNTGGKMSRKRTIHDLRAIARTRQSEWWARIFDELFFMYLSGMRGFNDDYVFPTSYTSGFAGNAFVAPDAQHILYGGDASSTAGLNAGDEMTVGLIERAQTRASTMGGGTSGVPSIEPIRINGEEHFVCVMHPFQEYNMRTISGSVWLDIQKAAAGAEGRNNPIFKGGLGMVNNTVLHSHKAVIKSHTSVNARRALFMGRQAAVVAFGSPGTGLRFDWTEETEDRGNQVVISTSSIFGMKKTAFSIEGTSRDFGIIALDTLATDPS